MDEAEARAWLAHCDVPRETFARLECLVDLIVRENGRQNLIAASTLPSIWSRHIVDSAQLLDAADKWPGHWIDIGSGAGFPGLVVALLSDWTVDCIDSRARRVAFLRHAVETLGLGDRVTVVQGEVGKTAIARRYDVISARAVAPLDQLFRIGRSVASDAATWLLPKGRSAARELADARHTWQGDFQLVPSITDAAAAIVVARNVRPR